VARTALLLASLIARAKAEGLDWVVEAFTELYKTTYKEAYQDGKNDAHTREWQGEE
jgi:hypothetical protein